MEYDRLRDQLSASANEHAPAEPPAPTSGEPQRANQRARRRPAPGTRRAESDARRTVRTDQRHLVRQLALLALFELDVTQHDFDEVITRVVESAFLDDPDSEGIPSPGQAQLDVTIPKEALRDKDEVTRQVHALVMGVISNAESLDRLLQEAAPALPVSQIAVVDRNVLRIGLYQLLFDESVPDFAAINEAVELAKRFGGERSAAFVNGVLRAVQQSRRAQAPPESSTPPPTDQSSGKPDTP